MLTLLPRTTGRFSRSGLKVNKLRYHCEGYTEQYLSGGDVTVAYNPEDVTSVWLLKDGAYTEFTIIASRFKSKDLTVVQELQARGPLSRVLPEIIYRHKSIWLNILRLSLLRLVVMLMFR